MVHVGKVYPGWNPGRLLSQAVADGLGNFPTEWQGTMTRATGPATAGVPVPWRALVPTYPLTGLSVVYKGTIPAQPGFTINQTHTFTWSNTLSGFLCDFEVEVNGLTAWTGVQTFASSVVNPMVNWIFEPIFGGNLVGGAGRALLGNFFETAAYWVPWSLGPPQTSPF